MRKITALSVAGLMTASLALAAPAHADQIDQALAAIPQGQISCETAARYWTNEADFQNKVAQANMLAAVDRRGPQIRDALTRVEEAANRCGLRGGGPAAPAGAPANNAGAPAAAGAPGAPAAAGAPAAPAAPKVAANLAPAGSPVVYVDVPFIGRVALPDLFAMVRDFLARFGIRI